MPRYPRLLLVCFGSLVLTACAHQNNAKDMNTQASSPAMAQQATLPHVMLGIRMATAGPALAKHIGVDPNNATLVTYVAPDTPAQRAGLTDWDVIVKINGSESASPTAIRKVVRAGQPGDTVNFSVWDNGSLKNVAVILAPADHDRMIPVMSSTTN